MTLMSGTAIAQLLPILMSPVVTRLYSPAEIGVYTVFMAFTSGIATIAAWRYDLAIVLPKQDRDARALVRLAMILGAFTCLGIGVILFVVAEQVSDVMGMPELEGLLAFSGLTAWATSQAAILNYWSNRQKSYRLMSTTRIGLSATMQGAQVGLGIAGVGTSALIVSTFLGQMYASIRLYFANRKEIFGRPRSSMKAMARAHRKLPLLNGPTALMDAARLQGTTVLIGAFFSAGAIGQYGQAWKLLQGPAALINSSLSQVFFQKMAVTPPGGMLPLVRRAVVRSAAIGAVPFGLIFLLAPPLFPVIFGSRWALAGEIGAALVPWLYVNFVTSPLSMLFIVARRQGVVFWFGWVFTAAPLLLLWFYHEDILLTVRWLSWMMAILLCVYVGLALRVARDYDHSSDSPS
ncbi:hypothetical protein BKM78_13125 [Tessaracoccus sp. T2.5-30]|nr:hypothetical protein BKM78_13125 [Tessaracoccus sp. T2.5-30]